MFNRRALSLVAFSVSLLFSSLMCSLPGDREEDERRESDQLLQQDMTRVAEEATRLSHEATETAQASITPSAQPTHTPTAPPTSTGLPTSTGVPTSTPPLPAATSDGSYYTFDSNDLPASMFSVTDPSGDSYWCESGGSFGDPAVDILGIHVYDPQSLGATHHNWYVLVELGVPANTTFTNDWSASVLVAFAAPGASAYTITYNEIHAGHSTQGTLDESGQAILPGTAGNTFIDDLGNIWFVIPADTMFMQVASFHTPTEDLPPEQKRCDVAPNHDVYTLDLP